MGMNPNMLGPIFTIGHSSHPIDLFLGLLKNHGIEAVADTRSYPKSKFAPQYNSEALGRSLRENGITYLFLGKDLGGRPEGAHFYDADGRVLYARVAESELFRKGLERLQEQMQRFRVAMLCSEEDPSVCHRRLLITRVLRERGIAAIHIRASGAVESEEEILASEAAKAAQDPQLTLFEHSPVSEWKSIPSVLPKRQQNSSSAS
jgi:uncharacterized protein (DUF488 family)